MKNDAKTIREWFASQYDNDDTQAIYDHGCVSGCASGLIYYSDTNAIYDQFAEEIHDIVNDYFIDCGCELPASITDYLGSLTQFKNAMVWACVEIIAAEIINLQELA